MTKLQKLSKWVSGAVGRVAHYTLGIHLCQKRIDHFEQRVKLAESGHHPELLKRAKIELSKWRIRQTKLVRLKSHWRDVVRERRGTKKKWVESHTDQFPPSTMGPNFVIFDGHDLPKWMAEVNQRARDSGEWTGEVFGGVRSPAYSRELCESMCGAPSCAGRCAGESSNHACPPDGAGTEYEGAEDVTDPYGLRHYCETHDEPLVGGGAVLPADVPHFSHEGN